MSRHGGIKYRSKARELVSVIVAVYNVEKYLPHCVDSILAQVYDNLEIILVDDGSTDNSGVVCDHYARKDDRVKVIHKPNGGLSDARNAGLNSASGAYIGFVDGDDWIEPDMYLAMYEACRDRNAQMAVCRYKQITKNGMIDASTGDSVLLTREQALEIYLCGHEQYVIYNSVWSKLFAREVIGSVRFPVGKNSEDILFTTQAFTRIKRCVYLDTAYYNYVVDRDGSIMNEKVGERRLRDEIPFWREQIAFLRQAGMPEMSGKAAYHFYRRLLFYYLDFRKQTDTKKYAQEIAKELKADRTVIRRLYRNSYVSLGDKARMRLMLTSPDGYYYTVWLYDRTLLPLRRLLHKRKKRK